MLATSDNIYQNILKESQHPGDNFPQFIQLQDEVPAIFKEKAGKDSISDTTDSFIVQQKYTKEFRPSIFSSHALKPENSGPVTRNSPLFDWVIGILLLIFLILVWVRSTFGRRFTQIFKAVFAAKHMNLLLREGNYFRETIFYFLYTNYIISLSLLIFLSGKEYFGMFRLGNEFGSFIKIVALVLSYTLIKALIIRMVGVIFKTKNQTNEYLANIYIFDNISGVLFFPMLGLALYANFSLALMFGFVLLAVLLIIRLLKGFFIGSAVIKFSSLHYFFYFCTLEILPIVFIVKFLNSSLLNY